jgi:hypothetical protein
MASGLPFIIVRGEAKEYGTANRVEGPFEPGELVCLLEDVVTSGGARWRCRPCDEGSSSRMRSAWSIGRVDRTSARAGVRLGPSAPRALEVHKTAGKQRLAKYVGLMGSSIP